MALRLGFALILLISVLFLPFWVSVMLMLIGMFFFSYFVEGVALFLLSDLLYGVEESRYLGLVFVSFLVSILCLIGIEIFKTRIRAFGFNNKLK